MEKAEVRFSETQRIRREILKRFSFPSSSFDVHFSLDNGYKM